MKEDKILTFFDMICFAKLFSSITNCNVTISDVEKEVAAKVLKEFGDSAPYWNSAQKEIYKTMVDVAKENSRGQRNG